MNEKIIVSGFGGQGVLLVGQMLTYSGMLETKEVSWLPSYGPEMRGGTANCHVMVSDEPVASPVVTEATTLFALNSPSLDKFEDKVKSGGLIIVNSSLIERKVKRKDVDVIYIPANEIADKLGSAKFANMVMLGVYQKKSKSIKIESLIESLKKVLGPKKEKFVPMNIEALSKGAEHIKWLDKK